MRTPDHSFGVGRFLHLGHGHMLSFASHVAQLAHSSGRSDTPEHRDSDRHTLLATLTSLCGCGLRTYQEKHPCYTRLCSLHPRGSDPEKGYWFYIFPPEQGRNPSSRSYCRNAGDIPTPGLTELLRWGQRAVAEEEARGWALSGKRPPAHLNLLCRGPQRPQERSERRQTMRI